MMIIAKKRIWTKEELSDIIYRYTELGETISFISKAYRTRYTTISNMLKNEGIVISNASVNRLFRHDFFETIDAEDKAYWLGYMVADGNVTLDSSGSRNPNIGISSIDIETVEGIAKATRTGAKPYEDRRPQYKGGVCYEWNVRSKKMADDLAKYGVIPNKTAHNDSLNIELIPNDLLKHYVRGLYDGDGSIFYLKESNVWQSNITSNSEKFLYELQDVTSKVIGRPANKVITNHNDIYKLVYAEHDTVILFD